MKKWGADGLKFLDAPGDHPAMEQASKFLHSTEVPRSKSMIDFLLHSTIKQLKEPSDRSLLQGAQKVHKILFPGSG